MMLLGLGAAAMAAGPHDALNCSGCHNIHYAVGSKVFAVNNNQADNLRAGAPIDGVSGLCLGCHEQANNPTPAYIKPEVKEKK
ncbi:MAG: hypothetical protein M1379_01020 [Firmicutes bacterium]|nr:hypothetical protein [Bacillota bacterium]